VTPPELPLLGALSKLEGEVDFSNTVLVGVQHLLASNISMLVKLREAGLDYERMFLLGKIYSTNPEVATTLEEFGVFVHQSSCELDRVSLLKDYHNQLGRAADDLLATANRQLRVEPEPRKLLVIDDGATLIRSVNHHRECIDADVVAVEQTTSGAQVLKERPSILFPVINVAESEAKRRHESPHVASSIIENLENRIQALPLKTTLADVVALIVGIGAVGMEVAKRLKNKVAGLAVHDVNPERLIAAHNAGFRVVDLREGLRRSHIVIGCVGKSWLPDDGAQLIQDGTVLINGSSSNIEFLGLNVLNGQGGAGFQLAHRNYPVKVQDGKAWVLNGGFPVNFDGSADPIPPLMIQFTRGLMLAGIYQAMASSPTERGLITLEERRQDFLIGAASNANII
jgi:S-adenosylhomocysteine hydrolase